MWKAGRMRSPASAVWVAMALTLIVAACRYQLPHQEMMLIDFESDADLDTVSVSHGDVISVSSKNGLAAKIVMDTDAHHIVSFEVRPETPWDFSDAGYVALAVDLINPMESSSNFYVTTADHKGQSQVRMALAPAQSAITVFVELEMPDLDLNTGMKANPVGWDYDGSTTYWRGGVRQLDLSGIASLKFDIRGELEDKTILIDNVRIIRPQNFHAENLTGIVDAFGQNAKQEFAGKISQVEHLIDSDAQERAGLISEPPVGRSKFNGWADGPRLDATGYFRTEKYQGKWALVDPEGYLFYSNGIANIRMANLSTLTGYDFAKGTIKEREQGDLTPEDSIGLNRAPDEALPTRYVSSDMRAQMFSWLPSYDDQLGAHYGYRREVHSGALERGETFSFYRANLARKYQVDDAVTLDQIWRDTTIDRMLSWGFTSFGNWVDPEFYQLNRFPYFANGWIIGDFKTVSSGSDFWSASPDPFDPVFRDRVFATVAQIAAEVQDSPWCVGVFIDNEMSWGITGSPASRYGIVIHTLGRSNDESPAKAAFANWLKGKYRSIEALNAAWDLSLSDWMDVDSGFEVAAPNDAVLADYSSLLELYGDKYFGTVREAMDELMPNHLYAGARFADWAMTPEGNNSAARFVDIMSVNFYREGISDVFWHFLADYDMPTIIGEFHNGAMDSGLFHPGTIMAASQGDRGRKYANYVNSALDHPNFVGTHWFQYVDSPLTGRAYDGENYNVGFVSVTDQPYLPLVEAAKRVNAEIYTRRYGGAQSASEAND